MCRTLADRTSWGDGGYQGQGDAIREAAPQAQDMTCRRSRYKDGVDEEARRGLANGRSTEEAA